MTIKGYTKLDIYLRIHTTAEISILRYEDIEFDKANYEKTESLII